MFSMTYLLSKIYEPNQLPAAWNQVHNVSELWTGSSQILID